MQAPQHAGVQLSDESCLSCAQISPSASSCASSCTNRSRTSVKGGLHAKSKSTTQTETFLCTHARIVKHLYQRHTSAVQAATVLSPLITKTLDSTHDATPYC